MRRQSRLGIALAVLFMTALYPRPDQADEAPRDCRLRGTTIDMTVQGDGGISVPVSIQDRVFQLRVDTGDVFTAITESAANALHPEIRQSPLVFGSLGGVTLTQYFEPDLLRLGPLSIVHPNVMIITDAMFDETDGLLGPDVMKNFDIDLDFARAKFGVLIQDHCPGDVVYWTKDAYSVVPMKVDSELHIAVSVTLDGKTINAIVDTGADKSTMDIGAAKALFGISANTPGMTHHDASINGAPIAPIYHYPFGSLSLGDISVIHPDIDLVDEPEALPRSEPMLIGVNILRQLHVYIAYKEQKLYVTPAEAK